MTIILVLFLYFPILQFDRKENTDSRFPCLKLQGMLSLDEINYFCPFSSIFILFFMFRNDEDPTTANSKVVLLQSVNTDIFQVYPIKGSFFALLASIVAYTDRT